MLIPKITYIGNTVNALVTPNIIGITLRDESLVSDGTITSRV
jgi:hypothetical protein